MRVGGRPFILKLKNHILIHKVEKVSFQASYYSSSFHRYLKHVLCCYGQLAFYPILLENLTLPPEGFNYTLSPILRPRFLQLEICPSDVITLLM